MPFIEVEFLVSDQDKRDLLTAVFEDLIFEGFEETDHSLKAYADVKTFNETEVAGVLSNYTALSDIKFITQVLPEKNWNEVWEQNFSPVNILEKVYIRATFHQPNASVPYEIVIDPKMAFGTGHHATTQMMIEMMLEDNLKNKQVLDFGSGTGILSILAQKMEASSVVAIDNDQWAYDNILENINTNASSNIKVLLGDEGNIPVAKFDYILANVNKMIILKCLDILACRAVNGGSILLSGILKVDEKEILIETDKNDLQIAAKKIKNEWMCLKLIKK